MMSNERLLSRIQSCRNLPVIPGISLQVLQLSRNSDFTSNDLVKLISQDPILASKVLRAANFAVPREVTSLHQAVVILGIRKVSTLALGVSLTATFGQVDSDSAALQDIWRRSLYTALAGRLLSAETAAGLEDEVFLCGLFQDVGVLGLLTALGSEYEDFLAEAGSHSQLAAAEVQAFDIDHACVGAAMAGWWSLPENMVQSIACHHDIGRVPKHLLPVQRIVVASQIAADVLLAEDTKAAAEKAREHLDEVFELSPESIQNILERLAREAAELSDIFEVEVLSDSEMAVTLAQAQETLVRAALEADTEVQRLNDLNRELSENIGRDKLTGLNNRTCLDEVIGDVFEQARKSRQTISVLFIDADKFKAINDTYGHACGDEVLRRLGKTLSDVCGEGAFRFGGEEFICLLPEHDIKQAVAVGEKVRSAVEAEEIRHGDTTLRLTVSIGVASTGPDFYTPSVSELVAAADLAVYEAKDSGRNKVCVREMLAC